MIERHVVAGSCENAETRAWRRPSGRSFALEEVANSDLRKGTIFEAVGHLG
jgi:hypothetical protein